MVMRPKSIATVVVVLLPTPPRSSVAMLALDRVSSVRSGRTSLTAPTSVVLPAPNPPATTILNAANRPSGRESERPEPMQHLLEQVAAGLLGRGLLRHDGDPAARDEVGEEDAHHA